MAEGEQHPPSHHSDQPSTQEGVNHDQNKDQDIQQELDYPPPPPAYPQDIPLQQANPSPPPLLLPPPPRYDYHSPFNDHPTYNIYVGNLNNQVDEGDLDTTFAPCGEITSTRVFREKSTGEHMGYGFVHFATKEAQLKALTPEFSHPFIKGSSAYTKSASEKNTLFVGNLPHDMGEGELREALLHIIGPFTDLELKTGPPPMHQSRGFCFITFADKQVADNARKILTKNLLKGRSLNVSWADPLPSSRDVDDATMSKVTTLYVSQIASSVTDEQLKEAFSPHGTVTKCHISRFPDSTESRGFGFVDFTTRDQCEVAIEAINGLELQGSHLSVVFAKPPVSKKGDDENTFASGHTAFGNGFGRGGSSAGPMRRRYGHDDSGRSGPRGERGMSGGGRGGGGGGGGGGGRGGWDNRDGSRGWGNNNNNYNNNDAWGNNNNNYNNHNYNHNNGNNNGGGWGGNGGGGRGGGGGGGGAWDGRGERGGGGWSNNSSRNGWNANGGWDRGGNSGGGGRGGWRSDGSWDRAQIDDMGSGRGWNEFSGDRGGRYDRRGSGDGGGRGWRGDWNRGGRGDRGGWEGGDGGRNGLNNRGGGGGRGASRGGGGGRGARGRVGGRGGSSPQQHSGRGGYGGSAHPQNYNGPPQYRSASSQYGNAPSHYGNPPSQYGNPQNTNSHYRSPPAQYGSPSSQFGSPPSQFGSGQQSYGSAQQYGTSSYPSYHQGATQGQQDYSAYQGRSQQPSSIPPTALESTTFPPVQPNQDNYSGSYAGARYTPY